MTGKNIFEIATRNKMRFPYKGMVSVEDLWDLSVNELDGIFKKLNSILKESNEESLLSEKSKDINVLEIKIDIVRHIVLVKQEEKRIREDEFDRAQKRQEILQIMKDRDKKAMLEMSDEDLRNMLENLK